MRNYRLLLLLALLTLVGTSHAQQYPFIRYDANVLHYDSTAAPMQFLFQKWQRITATGQGNMNIMHIGGSHVQAGTFPHRIRTNILRHYPTCVGSRGMVFPYSAAAKCNNPSDYKVHCPEPVTLCRNVYHNPENPLGLCGISITAHDQPTHIQMLLTDKEFDYTTTRIAVIGYSGQGVTPKLTYDNRQISPSYIDTANHRFIFNLHRAVDSFEIVLPCDKGEQFTLTGVYMGSRHPGISYTSIGVNGAAVPDYFKCVLSRDLSLVRPDLVIFGIGINDAHGNEFDSLAFKRNYLRLCDSIRSINPYCAFIFITNNDCYRKKGRSYSVNRNGLLVRDVCYRLAAITGGAVWDQFEIMGGLSSMQKWQQAKLAQADKVHFTRAGYQLLGDLFYEALDRELQKDWRAHTLKHGTGNSVERQTLKPNSKEKPLPRGLRRKPTHQHSNTPNSKPKKTDSDRFPYIPD